MSTGYSGPRKPKSDSAIKAAATRAMKKQREKELEDECNKLAKRFGWRWIGFHPLQNARGIWMTPIKGDAGGWPDRFLVHPKWGRVVLIELKADTGRVEPGQLEWLRRFADLAEFPGLTGLEAHLIHMRDLPTLGAILGRPEKHPNFGIEAASQTHKECS